MPSNKAHKNPKFGNLPLSTSGPVDCALTGSALLNTPYLNKGTAFTKEEREQFKLHGLLPQNIQTLEEQVKRAYDQYTSRPTDLAKNTFMTSMKEQNEVLYYRLIHDHLKEMFSIIYTPTEGEAIANYSRLFRRPEGCFLNIDDIDRIPDDLDQFGPSDEVDLIVVSDGEQILGIGDQGVGGILISIAKLVIYTLCAGIHPSRTLPVVLDCGTNNEELLKDDLYLGLRKPRVRGEEYDKFIDKFITSARKRYPKAYIHFEDFGLPNARRILDKYTPEIPCFNDDVQGTGCVTLAAIMSAMKVANVKYDDLRVLLFGAGTAGTGIADQIKDAIAVSTGKSTEEAGAQIWCVDKPGLLIKSKKDELTPAQIGYAREDSEWEGKNHNDLLSVVKEVKPHVLIGTSTQPGSFTKEVVEAMSQHVERPIIFPLSNPTKLHEAKPTDLFEWSKGKCLVATGSPFEPVEYEGKKYEIAECNNSTTFPGIGLGAVLARCRLMTPPLLVAATQALAAQAPALKEENKGTPQEVALLPDVTDVREISVQIAKAVIKKAVEEGLNQEKQIPQDDAELEEWIREQMWDPVYRPLRKISAEHASRHAKGEAGAGSVRRPGSFSYH
ncbi:Malic oxidoreductase [Macrophomina phaseolina MS6]|uniref:Malic enzyme n=1 Tax=Macrophomina phaseolina (strain MS6) TaxID=1126212 RepID=K2S7X3_MACPH|nr:Malic oxidoreductase [Macrophomina phaseolina MS6]